MFCSLEMDPAFADFNFSAIWDPTLSSGPRLRSVVRLVHGARNGHLPSEMELADTLYYTLRPAAFAAYQRKHGLAITYGEWFYSKLRQLLDALVYERLVVFDETRQGFREVEQPWHEGLDDLFLELGPHLTEDEIQEYLVPEDSERLSWGELVYAVSQAAAANRVSTLQEWLLKQRATRLLSSKGIRSWGKNQERDQVILSSLGSLMSRKQVCMELDRQGVPVSLPALEKNGFRRWVVAWDDPEGRQVIQRLFSKLASR